GSGEVLHRDGEGNLYLFRTLRDRHRGFFLVFLSRLGLSDELPAPAAKAGAAVVEVFASWKVSLPGGGLFFLARLLPFFLRFFLLPRLGPVRRRFSPLSLLCPRSGRRNPAAPLGAWLLALRGSLRYDRAHIALGGASHGQRPRGRGFQGALLGRGL